MEPTFVANFAEAKLNGPIVYCFWRKKRCRYVGKGKLGGVSLATKNQPTYFRRLALKYSSLKTRANWRRRSVSPHIYSNRATKE